MLAGMIFGGSELVALIVAISFAAGLNVYATVATLGLLAHAGLLDLPSGLHLISSWWVIAASGVLFAIEFFADKIPAFAGKATAGGSGRRGDCLSRPRW